MDNLLVHWQNFDFRIAGIIIITYIVLDGMYAYYTLAVTKKKPLNSAFVGSMMHFLVAFGVLNYIQNYLYILPIVVGSFIGTYFVVRYDLESGI